MKDSAKIFFMVKNLHPTSARQVSDSLTGVQLSQNCVSTEYYLFI